MHVVLRVGGWVERLRCGEAYRVIRSALAHLLDEPAFRICHVSIQHNHIHLLVEAADEHALAAGMQRFTIRVARRLNARRGTCGKVFAHRYHATQIRTPFHARHALAYVLNNWRRHREDRKSEDGLSARLDRYASGLAFDGWSDALRWIVPDEYTPLPVSRPRSWLLTVGWKRHGAIDLFEVPGPAI